MNQEDLVTFVRAAEAGSISAAARALAVPKSTVSRRIQRLEVEIGQPLLQRNSRAFRLTDAGRDLFDRAAPACRDLQDAWQAVRDGGAHPSGRLRVTAPTDFATVPEFVQMIAGFRGRFPGVVVELSLTDRLVDLLAEGLDFAFRAHGTPLDDRSTLKMRRLTTARAGLFATAAYLGTRGRPTHPAELAGHDLYLPRVSLSGPLELRAKDAEGPGFPLVSGVVTSSFAFVRTAVDVGLGIGVLMTTSAGGCPESLGRVERVLPGWELPSATLSLIWPANRQMAPRSRAFLDHAVACLGAAG